MREALSAEQVALASASICQQLAGWVVLRASRTVLTYLAFRNEIDLRVLPGLLPAIHWAIPRVEGKRLVLHSYEPDRLVRHRFGMLEPAAELPAVDPAVLDLVLVPGVAFDRHGGRLGFGGGYYDRFLPTTPALRVGIAYDMCLADELPCGEQDQRVDWVVTPTQWICMERGKRGKGKGGGMERGEWRRYEELRPDQLAGMVKRCPVAFWPLGLIEHHGWHLPVGLDGLKAAHICVRIAERTGGVVLPTMWWGSGGGHGGLMWTHYQEEEAAEAILVRTVGQLIAFGFQAILLLAGHYPWLRILNRHLPALEQEHPDILFLWGTEMEIGGEVRLPGDHAAREETSYGLALFPQWVDLEALRPGRDASAWPGGQAPPAESQHPGVCFDPGDPLFAQMGADARTASAERGQEAIARLVNSLAGRINAHLGRRPAVSV